MAGMWIVHVDVKDDERYGQYVTGSSKVVAAHDGEFIARGGRYEQREGRDFRRHVVIRFPTYDRAIEAYESAEYQALLDIARDSSERSLTILEIDD